MLRPITNIRVASVRFSHFRLMTSTSFGKQIFLSYVEYMARNYGQDCLICEYAQTMRAVNKFIKKYKLDLERISLYKRDILYRWIKLGFNESDILQLYYFDKSIELLELFIDEIENKYL